MDGLSLLFRLRGSNEVSPAIKSAQADIAKLTSTTSAQFGQMQGVATAALGRVTQSLTSLAGQTPIVGRAISVLSSELSTMAASSTGAGTSIAAIAGPIGIAVVAIGAAVAGVGLLSQQLFSLAQRAADFRGKLFDLSQQTGVSTETLSALEVIAKTTGGSIDSMAQSLVIFQGRLDEAQDSGSKAGKQFRELGISTASTEDALRDALRVLAAMPEGFRQTNAAAELFGRRGGKQFLAALKEMGGDLDATIAKLRELGLVISREDAEAADKFNDQLAILELQMRALLGKEIIPAALQALQDLSKFLKDNRQSINTVGSALSGLASIIGGVLKPELDFLSQQLNIINAALTIQEHLATRAGKALGLIAPTNFGAATGGVTGSGPPEAGVDLSFGAGIFRAGETAEAKAARLEARREEQLRADFLQGLNEDLKRVRDQLKGTNVETRAYAVEQSILNGVLKNGSTELQEMARNVAKSIDNTETQVRLTRELRAFLEQQEEAIRLAREGERDHFEIARELIKTIERQGGVLQETTKFWLLFNASILTSNDTANKLADALERAGEAAAKLEVPTLNEDVVAGLAGAAADATAGTPPALSSEMLVGIAAQQSAFEGLGVAISETLGLSVQAGQIIGETLTNAFSQLAFAVSEAVRSFVLFGKVEGGFKRFAAEVIASLAASAAVQAVYQLAQGLAWLALNFFFPNPAYAKAATTAFASAAVFGSITAVAGIGGRAAIGGAFNQTGSGAGGGAGGGSNNGQGQLNPLVLPRNQAQTVRHEHVIRVESNDSHIVKVITQNWEESGGIRELVFNDGKTH